MILTLTRRLFCNHDLWFVRNIYGDEINMVSVSRTYRSWWKCGKCGHWVPKEKLHK